MHRVCKPHPVHQDLKWIALAVAVFHGCSCIPVTVDTPATTPNTCLTIDACGHCNGDGSSCLGCDGQPGGAKWIDPCRVVCGDGSTCPNCLGDNCAVCTLAVDICGMCGGNGSTCVGCDGLPPTLTRPATKYDACGICGGNGTACLGCGGVPFGGPCPSAISAGAAAAVASLSALAAIAGIAAAAILLRLRKRPELLYQAWDDTFFFEGIPHRDRGESYCFSDWSRAQPSL